MKTKMIKITDRNDKNTIQWAISRKELKSILGFSNNTIQKVMDAINNGGIYAGKKHIVELVDVEIQIKEIVRD